MARLSSIVCSAIARLTVMTLTVGLVISLALAEEVSPGGSVMKRYDDVVPKLSAPESEAAHVAEIEDALEPMLGENFVYHELISTTIHLDVLVFRPTAERNQWTFVTSGMSDLPMTVPEGLDPDDYGFAELVIAVPADWFAEDGNGMIVESQLNDETKYWPIRLLKFLGRFPHEYETWFWGSHSIPNGDPAEPFAANTRLSGVVLAPLTGWPEKYRTVVLKNGTRVSLFAVIPVYDDEMKVKLDVGFDSLFAALEKRGVREIVDVTRPSVAAEVTN